MIPLHSCVCSFNFFQHTHTLTPQLCLFSQQSPLYITAGLGAWGGTPTPHNTQTEQNPALNTTPPSASWGWCIKQNSYVSTWLLSQRQCEVNLWKRRRFVPPFPKSLPRHKVKVFIVLTVLSGVKCVLSCLRDDMHPLFANPLRITCTSTSHLIPCNSIPHTSSHNPLFSVVADM